MDFGGALGVMKVAQALPVLAKSATSVARGLVSSVIPGMRSSHTSSSQVASRLHGATHAMPSFSQMSGMSLKDVFGAREELLAAIQQAAGTIFQEAGVDLSEPLVLDVNDDGQIIVANDHPDKDAIESLLAENEVLGGQIRGMLALEGVMAAAQKQAAFRAGYGQASVVGAPGGTRALLALQDDAIKVVHAAA